MREPVNRTILLLDIERFGRRDDVVQTVLRRSLNSIVDRTLVAAGVEATHQYREDRGDGLIVLLGGDVAKTAVLRALLTVTPELLHDHNRLASSTAQMRVRIVLAAGEITHDPHASTLGGVVGHDLNQACRLLDSEVLRTALAAQAQEECVLMVSTAVYEGVVRHGHRGVRPERFRYTDVPVKDGVLGGWLHLGQPAPDEPEDEPAPRTAHTRPAGTPPGSAPPPDAAAATPGAGQSAPARPAERGPGAVFHFGGAPVVHGSIVGGDQYGVVGGQVTGDVVLGGSVAPRAAAPDSDRDGSAS